MPTLLGRLARLIGRDRQAQNALSVRLRSVFPHKGYREHQRVPLWHPAVPFVLITSQRAGSTMGTAWFLHHAGLLEEAKAHDPFVHRFEQEVFLRQADYFDGLESALADKPVFKLVREPGARAFSSYLHLHSLEAAKEGDHRQALRRQIMKACGLDPAPETPLPFEAFLRWLATADHDRLDGHEARQVNAYEDSLPGGLPEPIKLEDASRLLPEIEERLGLPVSGQSQLQAFGASAHYVEKTGDDAQIEEILREGISLPRSGKMPVIETRSLRAFPEAHAALIEGFEADYLRFGYPRYLKQD
ncbi:hypothetical protein HK107_04545 [Parvularcula sp. ZS-1/3]|uniref:Sulfotransferase family protein n=1 Tax=Parvularcula mediterranea TaxID=2732508 RepID=A0A7Y3RK69_9PROT|nr:hypothetical protein [Parvularcula mediterranea]NNU15587.1 hypothetical protein [Parvularcula mediterranea]